MSIIFYSTLFLYILFSLFPQCYLIFPMIHWKSGIHNFIWSRKTLLYDIREPRYKQIKMGYQISKFSHLGQSCVLKSDTAAVYA